MDNKLIFLMGVSGAGKSTVLEKILTHTTYITVNTTTTRPIRPGEINGVTYDFVSDERFDELVQHDDFIEYAWVHKKYRYGTRKSLIQKATQEGHHVIIKNLEIFGWEQIVTNLETRSYCCSIFMDIPDEEIVARIKERDPDIGDEEVQRRLESAIYEREQSKKMCDYYVNVYGMDRDQQYDYILSLIDRIIHPEH